ncbi:UDP-2,3-diacylglucosamine diphosphatase LpxI [Pelagibacterales bacterium SAG-MED29]|nr:UDP-2,3-diacylglucosamine diphosphatase LpxI [Pelagibacterales bacterium SAG-MED29]
MIGLIFGETDFPKQILKKVKSKKRYLIIDLTKRKTFKKDKNSYSVSLGQFGKIIKILKEKKCKKVLFAGKVKKPGFSKLRLDLKGLYYIPRIIKSSKLGDASILKEIINIFKKERITTISSLFFNPELTLKKGNYSKIKPNREDKIDIHQAIKTLSRLRKYTFSQGTVVRNEKVIAIEGKGGTQKMLKRCKSKKFKNKGVLVKLPKKGQDLRIDLPTVGLRTLKQCKLAGLKGIVLKNKQNVFLEKNKCISFANKNKMFIKVK